MRFGLNFPGCEASGTSEVEDELPLHPLPGPRYLCEAPSSEVMDTWVPRYRDKNTAPQDSGSLGLGCWTGIRQAWAAASCVHRHRLDP